MEFSSSLLRDLKDLIFNWGTDNEFILGFLFSKLAFSKILLLLLYLFKFLLLINFWVINSSSSFNLLNFSFNILYLSFNCFIYNSFWFNLFCIPSIKVLISFPLCSNFLIISITLFVALVKLSEIKFKIFADSESDLLKKSSKYFVLKKFKTFIFATKTFVAYMKFGSLFFTEELIISIWFLKKFSKFDKKSLFCSDSGTTEEIFSVIFEYNLVKRGFSSSNDIFKVSSSYKSKIILFCSFKLISISSLAFWACWLFWFASSDDIILFSFILFYFRFWKNN